MSNSGWIASDKHWPACERCPCTKTEKKMRDETRYVHRAVQAAAKAIREVLVVG